MVADWASSAKFEALELACWPKSSGPSRRYAGTCHIDVDSFSKTRGDEVLGLLKEKGLSISALGYYPNPLHPDAGQRKAVIDHLKKLISAAGQMEVGIVNTFCGGDARRNVDENWDEAVKVWPELIAYAHDRGVKLAFENSPMLFSYNEWPGGHNIAYSPYIWRRIIDAWDGAVGLNFDPSHLNWATVFSGLYRAGYDGPVIIEHEDRQLDGSDNAVKRGFLLARDIVRPFIK